MAKRVESILERQLAYCERWKKFIEEGHVTIRGGRGSKLAALEEVSESIEIIQEALARHRANMQIVGKVDADV